MRTAFLVGLLLAPLVSISAQRDVIRAGIDLVVVPVSVRDTKGQLIRHLEKDEFRILEDGRPQEIRSFSVESMPLSVALLIDTGVDGPSLTNVSDAFRAIPKAFTASDEVEAFRFDHINDKITNFTTNPSDLEKKLAFIGKMAERQANRPAPLPVLPGRGPKWLRGLLGLDTGIEFKNLNDPLFAAAGDLAPRFKDRRKVIIVVSDGQVSDDSNKIIHATGQTKDQLVQNMIQFYGIAVGNALLTGSTSILHLYANATGGDVYGGHNRYDIEEALVSITTQARNQYVLAYVSNNEVRGRMPVVRKIDVETDAKDVTVHHRSSYLQYPKQ